MSSTSNKNTNLITSTLALVISNKLRSLGIKTSNNGYKFLVRAITIKVIEYDDNDFSNFNTIYEKVSNSFNNTKTPIQIDDCIYYSINHRNNKLTKNNFEKVFGFEYDEFIFTNKNFIDEISSIIRYNN